MATQAERRASTRRKIIDAAAKLFNQHGYEQVSVDQIVTQANVAKGTFYQYYPTKIDILADVVRREGEGRYKEALEKVEQGYSALAMLDQFLEVQCAWFENHAKVAEALIMSALKSIGDEATHNDPRYSRNFQTQLIALGQQQGEIRHDIPACEIAKMISGSMVLSVVAWSKNPQPNVLHPSMKNALKILLDGIRIKEQSHD